MSSKEKHIQKPIADLKTIPFDSTEEAWFWFIIAQQAKNDGARFVAGSGAIPRPCEPIDILRILDRLYRTRRLLRDHLLVLRHYGRRQLAPDSRRIKEVRSDMLWREAMARLSVVFERKGIIQKKKLPHENWHEEAVILQGGGI